MSQELRLEAHHRQRFQWCSLYSSGFPGRCCGHFVSVSEPSVLCFCDMQGKQSQPALWCCRFNALVVITLNDARAWHRKAERTPPSGVRDSSRRAVFGCVNYNDIV